MEYEDNGASRYLFVGLAYENPVDTRGGGHGDELHSFWKAMAQRGFAYKDVINDYWAHWSWLRCPDFNANEQVSEAARDMDAYLRKAVEDVVNQIQNYMAAASDAWRSVRRQ